MITAKNIVSCMVCSKVLQKNIAESEGWDWIEEIEGLCPCGENVLVCAHDYTESHIGRCPECQEYDRREWNDFMPISQPEQLGLF